MTEKNRTMSRKEFIKKSSAVLMGAGLAGPRTPPPVRSGAPDAPAHPVSLGRTGIRIHPIGFGASRTMEAALMRAALDAGVNFFDTGRSYFNGRNEEMVGEVVAGRRKELVIQSKLRLGIRADVAAELTKEDVGRMTRTMTESLETSLRALGTDYIDIMLIHGASSPEISHHEAVKEFFTAARRSGKIRAHGFSSHSNQVEMVRAAVRENFFDVIMIPYNHKGSYVHSNTGRYSEWDQPALEAGMEKARDLGIGLLAMKACSGGPYAPKAGGAPSFERALRWLLEGGRVHGMAVAMANFQQIEEDLRALT